MKISVCLVALGLGVALGQAAEEEFKPEGTHAEIEPIQFGTHPSGKPITIKTIAMSRDDDLLVGISWGEARWNSRSHAVTTMSAAGAAGIGAHGVPVVNAVPAD